MVVAVDPVSVPVIAPVELFRVSPIVVAGVSAFDVKTLVTSEYVIACPSGSVAFTEIPDNVVFFCIPEPILPAEVVQVGDDPASSAASNNVCPPSGFVTLTP